MLFRNHKHGVCYVSFSSIFIKIVSPRTNLNFRFVLSQSQEKIIVLTQPFLTICLSLFLNCIRLCPIFCLFSAITASKTPKNHFYRDILTKNTIFEPKISHTINLKQFETSRIIFKCVYLALPSPRKLLTSSQHDRLWQPYGSHQGSQANIAYPMMLVGWGPNGFPIG